MTTCKFREVIKSLCRFCRACSDLFFSDPSQCEETWEPKQGLGWGLHLIARVELRRPKNVGLRPSLVKPLGCSLVKDLSQNQSSKQVLQLLYSNWSQFILSWCNLRHLHLIHLEIVTKKFWDSRETSFPSPSIERMLLPYLNTFLSARMPQNLCPSQCIISGITWYSYVSCWWC